MENRERDHLLVLKVMRLTKPSLYAIYPVAGDSGYFASGILDAAVKKDFGSRNQLECFNSGNFLMLPQSFGNIYLGEIFSCYMSVHNNSLQTVTNVNVQADLQIGMQKIILTGKKGDCPYVTTLDSDESVDGVIHHEVKEVGTHVLACTVSYININNERMQFRKFFKFQVSKPLDLKTKLTACNGVYLEASLQNLTHAPMCLEKVSLEPSTNFSLQTPNSIEDNNSGHLVFDAVNCLNPLDSKQYLFYLTPRADSQVDMKLFKGISTIGKLDIVWRTSMGEKGRLQTSQLEKVASGYGEIQVSVEEIPSIVALEKPFSVTLRISNACERALDLVISLHNNFSSGILWQGISGQKLNKLEKNSFVVIVLEAIPVKLGLLMISGIKIKELFLKRIYDFDEVAQIFVSSEVA